MNEFLLALERLIKKYDAEISSQYDGTIEIVARKQTFCFISGIINEENLELYTSDIKNLKRKKHNG